MVIQLSLKKSVVSKKKKRLSTFVNNEAQFSTFLRVNNKRKKWDANGGMKVRV